MLRASYDERVVSASDALPALGERSLWATVSTQLSMIPLLASHEL